MQVFNVGAWWSQQGSGDNGPILWEDLGERGKINIKNEGGRYFPKCRKKHKRNPL